MSPKKTTLKSRNAWKTWWRESAEYTGGDMTMEEVLYYARRLTAYFMAG